MLLRLFGHLLDRVLVVVFAVGAAQFPMYYAQYADTLAGAQSEAAARYRELELAATQVNLSVDQFIERHASNTDPAIRESARLHRSTAIRFRRLEQALTRVREAPIWEKPIALAKVYDRQIAKAVQFTPGLPLTLEGLAWGFLGLLAAALLAGLVRGFYRLSQPPPQRPYGMPQP